MEYSDYFRFVAALILVLGLIGGLGVILRRYGGVIGGGALASRHANRSRRRLSVEEVLPLDGRRRLILVRRDDREHLLLLGPDGDRVVEDGINVSSDDAQDIPEPTRSVSLRAAAGGFRALMGGKAVEVNGPTPSPSPSPSDSTPSVSKTDD